MAEPDKFQLMLKAFYQKIQKLNADFSQNDIDRLVNGFRPELCNEDKVIDYAKFKDDPNYKTMLSSYCTALAQQQAHQIFEKFSDRKKSETPLPDHTMDDNVLIPKNWRVIDGGQK